jgi:hypothetical protein
MSSRAEIESLRNSNEMGFLGDVIMDPGDSFEGGVEIQSSFVAPIDAEKMIEARIYLFLPMAKNEVRDLLSRADYLYYFNGVTIQNSYFVRHFVWEQAKTRIKDLENTRLRADIPPRSLQRKATKKGIKKIWDEPLPGGRSFETDSIELFHLWKKREEFGSRFGSKMVLKNEKRSSPGGDKYTLDAILSSDQKDEFVRIFGEFVAQF